MARFGVRISRRQPRRLDRKPRKVKSDPRRRPLPAPYRVQAAVIPYHKLSAQVQAEQAAQRRRYDPSDDD